MRKTFYKNMMALTNECTGGYLAFIIEQGTLQDEFLGDKVFITNHTTIYENTNHQAYWDAYLKNHTIEGIDPQFLTGDCGEKIYIEYLQPNSTLVICGGGHVGLQVYNLSIMLGFDTIVVDNREAFANYERFPKAREVLCMPFEEALNKISSNGSTFFVIATNGHLNDRNCLETILNKPHAYIGMIGSKRKNSMIFNFLLEKGFEKEILDTVHAPIGLPIKAQTPEEIAVSIMAEIILAKRTCSTDVVINDAALIALSNADKPAALAVIIEKHGSIPRGAGAKMAIMENGRTIGTIGGGKLENDAKLKALDVIKEQKPCLLHYRLDHKSAEADGMICGGNALVYIEPIQ